MPRSWVGRPLYDFAGAPSLFVTEVRLEPWVCGTIARSCAVVCTAPPRVFCAESGVSTLTKHHPLSAQDLRQEDFALAHRSQVNNALGQSEVPPHSTTPNTRINQYSSIRLPPHRTHYE